MKRPETVLVAPSGPNRNAHGKDARMASQEDTTRDDTRNPEQSDNWKSIGDLARRIVERKNG